MIRVHHYEERDGWHVCKYCGENKPRSEPTATGPRWCPGKRPRADASAELEAVKAELARTVAARDSLSTALSMVAAQRDEAESDCDALRAQVARCEAEREQLLAMLERVVSAASEVTSWDWPELLINCHDSEVAARDAAFLEEQLPAARRLLATLADAERSEPHPSFAASKARVLDKHAGLLGRLTDGEDEERWEPVDCAECAGTGEIVPGATCAACSGTGRAYGGEE